MSYISRDLLDNHLIIAFPYIDINKLQLTVNVELPRQKLDKKNTRSKISVSTQV